MRVVERPCLVGAVLGSLNTQYRTQLAVWGSRHTPLRFNYFYIAHELWAQTINQAKSSCVYVCTTWHHGWHLLLSRWQNVALDTKSAIVERKLMTLQNMDCCSLQLPVA